MNRRRILRELAQRLKTFPVVALLGPRQCGKTTLARQVVKKIRTSGAQFFDLENPRDLARLSDPMLTLEQAPQFVVLDEVQRLPELFPILRVLVDRPQLKQRFLVLGSASGDLLRQSSESLAGRISFMELTPFTHYEVQNINRLWLRGGYPRAYIPAKRSDAFRWLDDYITTLLERDIPALGVRIPSPAARRLWMMLAHVHGQVLNASELARSLGLSDKTTRHYINVFTETMLVRQLHPWFENISKRQVKSPKIYIRDSGVFHALLDIHSNEALWGHPKVGASWEGFALECVIRQFDLRANECFFWATHADAELDLLTFIGGKRIGFEFKRSSAPSVTRSMRIAQTDLKLDSIFVICPGNDEFMLADRIHAVGIGQLANPTGIIAKVRKG